MSQGRIGLAQHLIWSMRISQIDVDPEHLLARVRPVGADLRQHSLDVVSAPGLLGVVRAAVGDQQADPTRSQTRGDGTANTPPSAHPGNDCDPPSQVLPVSAAHDLQAITARQGPRSLVRAWLHGPLPRH